MSEDELVQQLIDKVRSLDRIQLGLVIGVADILQKKVVVARLPSSDLASDQFMIAFGNRLLLHHAFTYAPLSKKHFEHSFEAAAKDAGLSASVTQNPTNPGEDMSLNGARCSLKTEASASIRDHFITISKFSEARWIQQCDDIDQLANAVVTRIPAQLGHLDRMFILRFLLRENGVAEYQLVEIPIPILNQLEKLSVTDFTPRTRQGGSSASVFQNGRRVFTLRLDGSDGKITIANLSLDACTIHGTWRFFAGNTIDSAEP